MRQNRRLFERRGQDPGRWGPVKTVLPAGANWDFTFSVKSCIVVREQSRRRRVKCHRDGELPGGRRMGSTMLSPHPLLHIGTNLLYVATILGRANGRLYIAALSHRSSGKPAAPRRLWRWGFFVFRAVGTVCQNAMSLRASAHTGVAISLNFINSLSLERFLFFAGDRHTSLRTGSR